MKKIKKTLSKYVLSSIVSLSAVTMATGCSGAPFRKPAQASVTGSASAVGAPVLQCGLTKNGWAGMPTDLSEIPGTIQAPTVVSTVQKPLLFATNAVSPPMIHLSGSSMERTSDNNYYAYTFQVTITPIMEDDAQVDINVADNVNKSSSVVQLRGINLSSSNLSFETTAYAGSFSSGTHLLCALLKQ